MVGPRKGIGGWGRPAPPPAETPDQSKKKYKSLKTFRTCQICGRVTSASQVDGWLVSPMRRHPNILVVRCPQHISEWSLRTSQAGRTVAMRKLMKEGREKPPLPIPPWVSPFPAFDYEDIHLIMKEAPKYDVNQIDERDFDRFRRRPKILEEGDNQGAT